MFKINVSGSFNRTESYLQRLEKLDPASILEKYGEMGVNALSRATPTETGLAAHSWFYEVSVKGGVYTISWMNSDVENGFPVAIMLQYGYATGTGGYVQGRDYINPAIKPIFDQIEAEVWKVVTSS